MPNPNITTNLHQGTLANTSKKLVFLGQIFIGLLSVIHFLIWSVSHPRGFFVPSYTALCCASHHTPRPFEQLPFSSNIAQLPGLVLDYFTPFITLLLLFFVSFIIYFLPFSVFVVFWTNKSENVKNNIFINIFYRY